MAGYPDYEPGISICELSALTFMPIGDSSLLCTLTEVTARLHHLNPPCWAVMQVNFCSFCNRNPPPSVHRLPEEGDELRGVTLSCRTFYPPAEGGTVLPLDMMGWVTQVNLET